MPVEALYFAVPSSMQRLSHRRFLAVINSEARHVEISHRAAEILSHCQGAQSLENHAAVAWKLGLAPTSDQVIIEINGLVNAGLLRRLPERPPSDRASAHDSATKALNTVVVLTADRPDALRRCLRSLIDQCRKHGRAPRIVVIDGSRDEAGTEKVITESRRLTPIEHIGRSAVATFRQMLISRHISPHLADLSASLGSIGANRNLALLLTAGDDLIMVDDDIVVDVWSHAHRDDGIAVGGHSDLREWRFFTTRKEATANLRYSDTDIIKGHQEVLGKSLSGLLATHRCLDLTNACSHTATAIADLQDLRVRCTFTGLAGDSGRYCAHRLLFSFGAPHDLLMNDQSAFNLALTSREIQHIATHTLIAHDPVGCASYCIGIANQVVTPPFMPLSRGEDTVFGSTWAFADPNALFAHLPIGVIHNSDRPATLDDPMPSARQTTMAEHLLYLLKHAARQTYGGDVAKRLCTYGDVLDEVGDMQARELLCVLHDPAVGARCHQVATLDALLNSSSYPECWRTAFEQYRSVFVESSQKPGFPIPVECTGQETQDACLLRVRRFMKHASELLRNWSDVWRAAAMAAYRA